MITRWSPEGVHVIPFRFFSVPCSDLSVFSLVSFSLSTGIVVEIWFVGSGALPSRTTTFVGGAGAGGVGVVPLLATVGAGLLPAGTPAEGFFATRLRGFGAGAGGGGVVVVVVVSVVDGAGAGSGCAGAGVSTVGASACGGGTAGFFFLQPDTESVAAASATMIANDRSRIIFSLSPLAHLFLSRVAWEVVFALRARSPASGHGCGTMFPCRRWNRNPSSRSSVARP